MTNYLLLYHGDAIVDAGNPTTTVKTVSQNGTADFGGDRVTGYGTVKAESLDEVTALATLRCKVKR